MPAGSAYPSGHLVPSPILGLANAPIVETKFLELAMSLFDFSPRIPLGTFSILLPTEMIYFNYLSYRNKHFTLLDVEVHESDVIGHSFPKKRHRANDNDLTS